MFKTTESDRFLRLIRENASHEAPSLTTAEDQSDPALPFDNITSLPCRNASKCTAEGKGQGVFLVNMMSVFCRGSFPEFLGEFQMWLVELLAEQRPLQG